MCAHNLQYQHQIEVHNIKQMPSSSSFQANVPPMPLLETPDCTVTNVQMNELGYNLTNGYPNQIQEESITLTTNVQQPSGNIVQPNTLIALPSSTTHEGKL